MKNTPLHQSKGSEKTELLPDFKTKHKTLTRLEAHTLTALTCKQCFSARPTVQYIFELW
jgi:hypothetical protein